MQDVLVLGAGFVAKPLIDYLLKHNISLTVADVRHDKALELVKDQSKGKAVELDIKNTSELEHLIKDHALTISLLPFIFHVTVAKACIKYRKNMVTASYVSPEMKRLQNEVCDAGIIILNEIGLDPGIDHMTAKKVIDEIHAKSGKVTGFRSYCGGLPAPESITSHFGYKFSWSPKGVLLAGKNSARFEYEGKIIYVPGRNLFTQFSYVDIPGIGRLEYYPNRDSIPYKDIYDIHEAKTMFRGTLRYPGWCKTMKYFVDLNLLDYAPRPHLKGKTYKDMMLDLINGREEICVRTQIADCLGVSEISDVMQRMDWLELFSDDPLPDADSFIDILSARMTEMQAYQEGEQDLVVLHHRFDAQYGDHEEFISSTLIETGDALKDSAMSRTVGLPAAIAIRLLLEGAIDETGIHIPIKPSIYNPVLDELEQLGIRCEEKTWSD